MSIGNMQQRTRTKNNIPLILSVLDYPAKSQLKQVQLQSCENSLWFHIQRKITLSAQKNSVQRSKLLTNLQIYEWRSQTQFPIIKTILVEVKQNQNQSSQLVEVMAYNQYCLLKLSQIYQLSLGQTLYTLKESLLGFERLYNRFGSFQILSSMIAFNQKGFCRVWVNQNYSVNFPTKRDANESSMIHKILYILQSHSQESRTIKKLFQYLRNYKSFYQIFRCIQQYVTKNKIYVPNKLINEQFNRQARRYNQNLQTCLNKNNNYAMSPSARFSIKQSVKNKIMQAIKDQLQSSIRNKKIDYSPLVIKRFKSQNSLKIIEGNFQSPKTFDEKTSHTGRANKTSNYSGKFIFKGQANTPEKQTIDSLDSPKVDKKKRLGWIQQSNFIMGEQQILNPERNIKKKDLSQSQFNLVQPTNRLDRKYSCRVSPEKKYNSLAKNLYSIKNSIQQPYFSEFQELLKDKKCQEYRNKPIQEEDQQKFRQQMSGNVIKNNGWVAKVSGLLNVTTKLQQSFHEEKDKEQPRVKANIRLQKLDKLGKNQMIMSFLKQ